MATQVKEVAKAGWSTSRAVTLAPQARRLLEGPVLPTLLRLAAPTVALMLLQGVIAAGEAAFVGRLGSAALAGVSLSFPLVMLMITLSAGAYGGGVASAYNHLSVIVVPAGAVVKAGQLVGRVGSTGLSTGPHLHLEIRLAGRPVDPVPFLRARGVLLVKTAA